LILLGLIAVAIIVINSNGVSQLLGIISKNHRLMEWILDNKEWIFSGIGVFIIGLIIAFFSRKKKNKSIKMKQKSGSNSTNTQIGGDFNG
jgi:plastocyanin domain-containing protein